MPNARLLALCALAVVGLAGCKKKIGDACTRSTDCSIRGDRVCDLSHRVDANGVSSKSGKGECTIEGCGHDTCPKEAECVKVYGTDFLTIACDPLREDIAIALEPSGDECPEQCTLVDGTYCACEPLDLCETHEVCLPEGLCADEITARTSCRRECKNDGDCREGYECVRTGARGVYRAPDLDRPGELDDVEICMPSP